ncbi:MAG: 16S rRNA (adenine(1518)-N(6)/adenine(1519)-N(6))-dimethyltransferase RsmA [Candidatus Micrarchaeia archaeon]
MRAKLGQNFLTDESVLDFEAESADVSGKSVLEIGAGDGRLTRRLLRHKAGHITAVEVDPKLAKLLRMAFHYRVSVLEADILSFDESRRFNCIVGNIPYYITSPILLKLSRMDFGKAVLCVQKEVAERMVAPAGSRNYGRLSVFCQLAFAIEPLAIVPREAFTPKPKVDSAVISISKTGLSLSSGEDSAIGAIFSHKKKSLRNAVVDSRKALFGGLDKQAALSIAQSLKYSERKVFTLTPAEALEAARELLSKK